MLERRLSHSPSFYCVCVCVCVWPIDSQWEEKGNDKKTNKRRGHVQTPHRVHDKRSTCTHTHKRAHTLAKGHPVVQQWVFLLITMRSCCLAHIVTNTHTDTQNLIDQPQRLTRSLKEATVTRSTNQWSRITSCFWTTAALNNFSFCCPPSKIPPQAGTSINNHK